MSEQHEQEPTEPTVADVPEPDQEPHEPIPDEADEHGEADADEAGELEPQPEPEPQAQGPSPEQIEKVWKATDRAVDAYVKKISAIWEESGLALTPFGLDPTAPLGFVNMDNAGHIDEETKGAAMSFLGFAREQDYKPDPQTRTCPTCDGKGKTKTGSQVASFMTRACPDCGGRGATGLDTSPAVPQGNGHKEDAFTLATSGPMEAADVDNWGEPRFLPDGSVNENFGRQPQYKVEHPTYGRTAGLTAQDAAV